MKIAVAKGRSTRPDIKLGICGEHGGDPMSVEFCHMVGLNYVSCSPYRVPVARLAAAQAALNHAYGHLVAARPVKAGAKARPAKKVAKKAVKKIAKKIVKKAPAKKPAKK